MEDNSKNELKMIRIVENTHGDLILRKKQNYK
jgi:hypothetical protein